MAVQVRQQLQAAPAALTAADASLKTPPKMKTSQTMNRPGTALVSLVLLGLVSAAVYGCESAASKPNENAAPAVELPVLNVARKPAVTYREYSISLEGTKDVQIRPQVSGYLDKIYVDEGAHVKQGQPLFRINDALYVQALRQAKADLQAAQAKLEASDINLVKLNPLVEHGVVSTVQLDEARAARDAARAGVAAAGAAVGTATVNLGYTLIKAPADGYVGRIPMKQGSLIEAGTTEPLTTVSSVDRVYAYFSMSEGDFLAFKHQYAGNTLAEKIARMPPVSLVLSDDSLYGETGKVDAVLGSFDKTMGTISFRAVFTNPHGLLRSGNTGKIRIPRPIVSQVVIPQQSTYELQDKVMVYQVDSRGRVEGRPVTVSGRSGHYYLIGSGLKPGDRIVYTGLDRLHDGMTIRPDMLQLDSLLSRDPL
jgi:membrane fusion protein (multidrug efflux system)